MSGPETTTPLQVDVAEANRRRDAGAPMLDVREPDEWAAGRVPGSVHVPLHTLPEHAPSLGRAMPWLVICRAGPRSLQATLYLRAVGVDAVNVGGGVTAWQRAGYAFENGAGGPGRVI